MMKCGVLLFVACFSCYVSNVLGAPHPPPFSLFFGKVPEDKVEQCGKSSGITKDDVAKRMNGEVHEAITDAQMCMLKCIMTESKVLQEDGMIDISAVKENLAPLVIDKADDIIDCLTKIDSPVKECSDIVGVFKCYPKKD